ncbi:Leukotriene A4 hydrolase, C-terminal [Flexibacter flexilis DSM 6793]|uniref:Aminopeptidase N n=1 Tax=Flexibacter flexilis DSM 6793 TaxID=927664 RepID=A0A1I1MVN1_9BACT|nr:M1 family metallopeptidase [Flexibacter flexilis]SFC89419.1 Leukotriene A4 hydrolase, C-terminal [Flexibacter flexilis DSM 6793]
MLEKKSKHWQTILVCCYLFLAQWAWAQTPKLPHSEPDQHSFAQPSVVRMTHLDLDIKVSFEKKQIAGVATLSIENLGNADELWIDSKDLTISKIYLDNDKTPTTFASTDEVPFLGRGVKIDIRPDTRKVHIHYHSSPKAEALQWLSAAQTAGKKFPFLFTQGEAILTRSWIPCQDSPNVRFTYSARVQVPRTHLAMMSATNPTKRNSSGIYEFKMEQAIPAYLVALAVGDVAFKPLGNRTGVYAEPATLPTAAHVLAETENMLVAAEKLYGEYAWKRYDLLILPPSFPFGGMENPRLTFATPTILAKDRSLTSLVAHELAHSWSGNLVTNATWDDFWLNEGFTVYFERRIMEALYGKSYTEMLAVLGYQDWQASNTDFAKTDTAATCLKLHLAGKDPDEGMTDIAYEKGAAFLTTLEKAVGREKFDVFLKNYFSSKAFQTITTEDFVIYLQQNLLSTEQFQSLHVQQWIYGAGIPSFFEVPVSARFQNVDKSVDLYVNKSQLPDKQTTKSWTTHEWVHFLRHLPSTLSLVQMQKLDAAFGFTQSVNAEIQFEWFLKSVQTNYELARAATEKFLIATGRRKYLVPLYKAMLATPAGRTEAQRIYKKARPNYHFVATNTLDELMK